jgi:translation initiation factor IF-3
VNETIQAREMMVISDTGEQLGLMGKKEAIERAYDRDLDLVLVAPNANPPVAKFMDYNRFKYEQQRQMKEAKKKQAVTTLKEIRLSPTIEKHDLETKQRNAIKFLDKGSKLKLSVRFRGRQLAHTDQGRKVLLEFAAACKDHAEVESHPKKDGKSMFMVLSPIKKDKK